MSSNPLISTTKTSESGLHAALHPLVLLTISDYITRHTLRNLKTPIVGALLGQQNGREITIEHAYDVKLVPQTEADSAGHWLLNEPWFEERLQQYKDVHKTPALDLVGWWTVSPNNGPDPEVMHIHQQVLKQNESALLLTFHPEAILSGTATGGKLPLTIYESIHEHVKGADTDGGEAMQIEGDEPTGEKLELKLKELRYDIATGEAEMISVDFVARGGGNATAIKGAVNPHAATAPETPQESKGKEPEEETVSTNLNAEEEEMISFLTSRANAIQMLQARVTSLKQHLDNLPPSYLNGTEQNPSSAPISHPVLRATLALTAKLPLIVPPDTEAFEHEQATERSDVALVQLMGDIGKSLQTTKGLGSKFAVVAGSQKGDKGLPSLAGSFGDADTLGMGHLASYGDSF